MNVNVFRIDDRLIHGQIVTKWIGEANAKTILVVDDKAAKDPIQQSILKFAVPSGVKLEILSKVDGLKRIQEDESNLNVLLLMRNPKEANAFLEMGFKIDRINLGNISNSKSVTGRTKLLDYIYVEEGDVAALQSIKEKGVALMVKAIPEEREKISLI